MAEKLIWRKEYKANQEKTRTFLGLWIPICWLFFSSLTEQYQDILKERVRKYKF